MIFHSCGAKYICKYGSLPGHQTTTLTSPVPQLNKVIKLCEQGSKDGTPLLDRNVIRTAYFKFARTFQMSSSWGANLYDLGSNKA